MKKNNASVRTQIKRMRQIWPKFRIIHKSKTNVCWEGTLTPIKQEYVVRVSFHIRNGRKYSHPLEAQPRVIVTEPLLHPRIEDPKDPIPHHYPNEADHDQPFLCLYDPASHEWEPSDAIADTIIPWTIDWLACYEGWLATGIWTGGGRHP